jgi:hypothetical protein
MRKVIEVHPQPGFCLKIVFDNKETKLFDVTPYMELGIFKELKNIEYFNKVTIKFSSVSWPNEQDFSPDTLYLLGKSELTNPC